MVIDICLKTTSHVIDICLKTTSHGIDICLKTTSHGIDICLKTTSHGIDICLKTTSHVIDICLKTTSHGIDIYAIQFLLTSAKVMLIKKCSTRWRTEDFSILKEGTLVLPKTKNLKVLIFFPVESFSALKHNRSINNIIIPKFTGIR